LGEYLARDAAEGKAVELLAEFETLYGYLQAIAHANGLRDPFDLQVVEAYWVGNELLDKVPEEGVYGALMEYQRLPRRIGKKEMRWLLPKVDQRARLHHSFHVFNVFTRTGHHTVGHTAETMDQCRIGWGQFLPDKFQMPNDKQMTNSKIQISSQKLVYREGQLKLLPAVRDVTVANPTLRKRLKPGDWVSFHWGFGCDVLTEAQAKRLERYTKHHLMLANTTL
jgi:hydrogenase maturation factor